MSTLQTRGEAPRATPQLGPGPGRTRVGSQSPGITGRDIWRIVRRRKWLIILPTLLFAAVAVGGTFLWLRYAPTYTATAYLEVRPGHAGVFEWQMDPGADVVQRKVLAQALRVSREVVLSAVLAEKSIQKLKWFKRNRDNALEELREVLTVEPVARTDMIRIAIDDYDREEAAELATAIAVAHVADVRKNEGSSDRSTIDLLEKQFQLKTTLLETNVNAQRRLRRDPLVSQSVTLRTRLEVHGRLLNQVGLAIAQASGINDAIKKQAKSGEMVNSPEVAAALEIDPRLRGLRQRQGDLSVVIETKRIQLGEQHRTVKNLKLQLKAVEKQIEERQEQVQDYQIKAMVERSQAGLDSLTAQQVQITKTYGETERKVQDAETILLALQRLATEADRIKEERDRIERRVNDLTLAKENRVPVSVIQRAERPAEPSSPQWVVTIPAGVLLGLLVGLGLAFLLEFVDASVKSPADIARRTDLAVLGTVPHTHDLEEDVDDIRRAFMDNRDSLVGEAFRHIRTCLQFSGPAEHRRSILITSPLPDDGRTAVTMNLAASIARSGRKVLVIDTNFRQPVASGLFVEDGASAPGLSNVLVAQARLNDVAHEIEPNLFIMPSGPMPPNPAELLGSAPMRELLAESIEGFDQVLLDAAPCLVVTDPAIISTIVDGVVLVVRAGANTHGMVQRAGHGLTRVGARVLGVVVNGVRATVGGYLREHYDRFYDYQEQIELPAD